jgi:cobalt/nickel transport system permease protein
MSAFSFVVMMFNIPIPGGTSGHATGVGILAVLFGPWVAFFSTEHRTCISGGKTCNFLI